MDISISPNSLNLFLECPCCFWLEKKHNIKRPVQYPYTLNAEVDAILKQDFDKHRKKKEFHPLILANNIPAKLFPNQKLLNEWRDNSKGMSYYDPTLNAKIFGVPDDILEFSDGKLMPFDYKTTGTKVANVYDRFQLQMDVYTYLLEKIGYKTMRKACLAFYIVDKENNFKDKLPFRKEIHIIDTDPSYVQKIFEDAVETINKSAAPKHSQDCVFGKWIDKIKKY